MWHHRWPVLLYVLVLSTTFVRSSPQTRYCGRKLTKALLELCGAVKSPSTDQLETGHRANGDLSIVHHCCRKPCDAAFMSRYCAK